MSHAKVWFVNNDMIIEVVATDKITDASIDDATVEATLKDSAGTDVTGISWPVSVPFISDGLYRVSVDKAAAVIDGDGYTLEIDFTTPGGVDAFWELPVGGETRKE